MRCRPGCSGRRSRGGPDGRRQRRRECRYLALSDRIYDCILALQTLLSIASPPLVKKSVHPPSPPLLTSSVLFSRPRLSPPPPLIPVYSAGAPGALPVRRAAVLLLVPLHPRHAGLREASAAGHAGGREALDGPAGRRGARDGAPGRVEGGQRLRRQVILAAHPRTGEGRGRVTRGPGRSALVLAAIVDRLCG